jgi:hypothetical protein
VLIDVDVTQVGWYTSGLGPIVGPAQDGIQYLDLVGYGTTGGIRQTIEVTPGASYGFTFAYSNNPSSAPTASATGRIRGCAGVLVAVEDFTHNTATASDLDWIVVTRTFVADGPFVLVEFENTAGGGAGGVFLDAIAITAAAFP